MMIVADESGSGSRPLADNGISGSGPPCWVLLPLCYFELNKWGHESRRCILFIFYCLYT